MGLGRRPASSDRPVGGRRPNPVAGPDPRPAGGARGASRPTLSQPLAGRTGWRSWAWSTGRQLQEGSGRSGRWDGDCGAARPRPDPRLGRLTWRHNRPSATLALSQPPLRPSSGFDALVVTHKSACAFSLHHYRSAEEPRTHPPDGSPLAPPDPRDTAARRRAPAAPWSPLEAPRPPLGSLGLTGPRGRRDHRCHRAAGAPPVPRRGGPDTAQEYRPGPRRHPGGRLELGAEQALGSRGIEFAPKQSPVIDSLAPWLPRGASRYAAPRPRPGGEDLGTGPPVRGRARAPPARHPGGCSGTSSPPYAGERVAERIPRAPADT